MRRFALVLVLVACGPKAAPQRSAPSQPVATAAAAPTSAPTPAPAPVAATIDVEAKLTEVMKAYDAMDLERARKLALDVVAIDELNVRALRVLVSVACLEGDSQEAKLRYLGLPELDRAQMRKRCERYGIALE